MDIKLPLSYYRGDHDASWKASKGLTANISQGGLYFYTSQNGHKLSVNQIWNLSIETASKDSQTPYLPWINVVDARAKILRIDKIDTCPGQIGVAVKFLEVPSVW